MRSKSRIITTLYAWNDSLWSLLACFLIAVVLLLAVAQQIKKDEEAKQTNAGNLSIYIEWDYDNDVDVDLWFSYPGCQGCPVYYGNRQTPRGWLGRDDVGSANSRQNNENATVYDLEPGEYAINVHAFGNHSKSFPAKVYAEINMKTDRGVERVYTGTVELKSVKDEVTIIRFNLDRDMRVTNKTHLFTPLVRQR
jgi:hypothetical protein